MPNAREPSRPDDSLCRQGGKRTFAHRARKVRHASREPSRLKRFATLPTVHVLVDTPVKRRGLPKKGVSRVQGASLCACGCRYFLWRRSCAGPASVAYELSHFRRLLCEDFSRRLPWADYVTALTSGVPGPTVREVFREPSRPYVSLCHHHSKTRVFAPSYSGRRRQ